MKLHIDIPSLTSFIKQSLELKLYTFIDCKTLSGKEKVKLCCLLEESLKFSCSTAKGAVKISHLLMFYPYKSQFIAFTENDYNSISELNNITEPITKFYNFKVIKLLEIKKKLRL